MTAAWTKGSACHFVRGLHVQRTYYRLDDTLCYWKLHFRDCLTMLPSRTLLHESRACRKLRGEEMMPVESCVRNTFWRKSNGLIWHIWIMWKPTTWRRINLPKQDQLTCIVISFSAFCIALSVLLQLQSKALSSDTRCLYYLLWFLYYSSYDYCYFILHIIIICQIKYNIYIYYNIIKI